MKNYKQNKIEEFKKKFDEIEVKEIESGNGEFFKISCRSGKHPDWLMGVQEGFTLCQDEAENFLSETIDEIIGCLPMEGNIENSYESFKNGVLYCRQEFLNNLNNKYGQK